MPGSIVHEQRGIAGEVSFQTLAENTPIGIYKTDAAGQRTYVNKTWREITGRSDEEAYGVGWARAIYIEDRQMVIDAWKQAVANQTDFKLEFRFDNPLKGLRWVRNQATPLRDSEGKITGYIGSIEDITQEKSFEHQLRESERRYRLLSENSSDLTLLTNFERRIVYISPSVKEILGYQPEELIGTIAMDLIHPDDIKLAKTKGDNIRQNDETIRTIVRMRRKDGEYRWVESNGRIFHQENEKETLVQASIRDIHENKLLEERLQNSEHLYRLLSETQTDFISLTDAERTYVYISPTIKDMLGYEPDHLIGKKRILDLVHPDDVEMVRKKGEDIRTNKLTTTSIVMRMRKKNGEYVWIESLAKMFQDGLKTNPLVLASHRNIDERIQLEQQLQESEKKYRLLSENSGDIILLANSKRQIEYISPSVKELLGYTPDEIIGKHTILELTHPEDVDAVFKRGEDIRARKTSIERIEMRLQKKDKTFLWVEALIKLLPHENSEKIPLVLGAIRDITERKMLENALKEAKEKAEEASKAKSMFLSTMSHEIRTPMNAIIGLTNLMVEEKPREDQIEKLNLLKFTGENLLAIINDILDFNKIEAGKIELEEITFNLREILGHNINLLKNRATEKGIDLTLELDDHLPDTVMGDPVRMGQVLNNLIGNAIKFTEHGYVNVIVSELGHKGHTHLIKFLVKDTGIGIKPEKVKEVFDNFTQASSDTTRKYGGTGLGLSISQKLIKLMGGEIKLQSEFGIGSEFSFDLRLKEGQNLLKPKISDERKYNGHTVGIEVLLVEDNKVNQVVAGNFLKKWGMVVRFANDGREACEMVTQNKFDVVLMDLQMPEMDGYQATQLIRAMNDSHLKTMPIIALSASAMIDVKEKAESSGFNGFIAKPFQPQELKEKILQLVPHRSKKSKLTKNLSNHLFEEYSQGNAEMKRELAGLFITNLQELRIALYNSIEKETEEYGQVLHKSKTTLAIINNQEFTRMALELKEKLNNRKQIKKANLLDFSRMTDDLIKDLEEEIQIEH